MPNAYKNKISVEWDVLLNFMELLGELIMNECLLCKCKRVSDCNNNNKVKLSK